MDDQMESTEAKVIAVHLSHMSGSIERLSKAVEDMGEKLERRMGDHETRLQSIERDMPGLKELRRYVIAGVVAGVGMIGAALMKLVVYDVPRLPPAVPAVAQQTTQPKVTP